MIINSFQERYSIERGKFFVNYILDVEGVIFMCGYSESETVMKFEVVHIIQLLQIQVIHQVLSMMSFLIKIQVNNQVLSMMSFITKIQVIH